MILLMAVWELGKPKLLFQMLQSLYKVPTMRRYFLHETPIAKIILIHIRGTNGWKIHDDIAVASIESDMAGVIIDKPTFGAFDIADELAEGNYDEVDLVGLCTDICVIANALILKTQFPEMKINIIENATAGTTPEAKQAALTVAKSCQINII